MSPHKPAIPEEWEVQMRDILYSSDYFSSQTMGLKQKASHDLKLKAEISCLFDNSTIMDP
jgi:hypothetical protein